jgi:hypothetical protein
MKYAYWAVICKECGRTLFPKGGYLGPCDETDTAIMIEFLPPEWCDLGCPDCNTVHKYTSADFSAIRMDHRIEPDVEHKH